jgi:hypothetical protein
MKTTYHHLPSTLTINNKSIKLNWRENANLDGFVAEIDCVPIDEFSNSEACEIYIFDSLGLTSDVYADGSASVYYKV